MDEKEKKCCLASFNGIPSAERNSGNYYRRDDGSHIYKNSEYYEWWHLDCSFDNGYHLVVNFHYMNMFLKPIIPSAQLMIYKPDGTQIVRYDLCKMEDTSAGADWCDLRMGESWLKDMGDGTYEMYIMNNKAGARLTMKRIVPAWKLGTGFSFKDEETGKVAGWVVSMPYAEVQGELFIKDKKIAVKGSAYYDHNWGNFPMYEKYSHRYWGHIHNGGYCISYAGVFPRDPDGPVFYPLLIAKGREIVLSTDIMQMELGNFAKDPATGRSYARSFLITADSLGVKMQLEINTTRLIEAMKLPMTVPWDQSYLRFLGDYTMDVEIDGGKERVQGEMIHEFIIL